MDVLGEYFSIAFRFDKDGPVPSLKKMATTLMFLVEIDGVCRIQKVHHARKIAQRRLENQMVMVGHKAIDMDDHAELFVGLPQAFEKEVKIIIGTKHDLLLVASRENVIERAGILDPQLSCQNNGSWA